MFIQTESTPNPQTMKFLPGQAVLAEGTRFYTNKAEAKESPLAEALFHIDGVSAVFLGSDFITITKQEAADWHLLKAHVLPAIMECFVAGTPVLADASPDSKKATDANADESQIVKEIRELIDTRVRPAVAMDGGDIIFHSYEEGIVRLEMHGACSGCPSSAVTLKQGIENMLKHYIPEVVAVEPVN